MADYLPHHPKLSISVEERSSQEIVHAIRNKTAEVGIVADSVGPAAEQKPFREDWLIVVVPAAHPLASQERSRSTRSPMPTSSASPTAARCRCISPARALGKRIRYRVQLKSFDAICRVIASGVGIGIVSRHAAERAMQTMDVRLVELSDAWSHRRLKLCARSFDALPKYTREFVAFLSGETAPR